MDGLIRNSGSWTLEQLKEENGRQVHAAEYVQRPFLGKGLQGGGDSHDGKQEIGELQGRANRVGKIRQEPAQQGNTRCQEDEKQPADSSQ
jgi:hypothetical protein